MKPEILSFDSSKEYFFEEGCYINELLNSDNDQAVSIAQARVAPQSRTRWHTLINTTERYQILQGEGLVEVGELPPTFVSAGDTVIIPPNTAQRITNQSQEDLVFLAICTPRFEAGNYRDIETP